MKATNSDFSVLGWGCCCSRTWGGNSSWEGQKEGVESEHLTESSSNSDHFGHSRIYRQLTRTTQHTLT